MKRKSSPRRSARSDADALSSDIGVLLEDIEREEVPERLLALARQLQEALAQKRAADRDKAEDELPRVKRL